MNRDQLVTRAVYFLLALLPWQTVLILSERTLLGGPWEYGKTALYATELLTVILFALRGVPQLPRSARALLVPSAGVLLALVLGAFVSAMPAVGFSFLLHVAAAACLAVLIADERMDASLARKAILIGLVPVCLLGIFQTFTGASPGSVVFGLSEHQGVVPGVSVVESTEGVRTLRAYGSFPHPNVFGGFLAIGILLAAWELSLLQSTRVRTALHVSLVLMSTTLVMTFSRGAWLGLAVGAGVTGIILLWTRRAIPRTALPIIGIAGCAILFTLICFRTEVLTRVAPTARLEERSLDERAAALASFDDVIRERPYFGVGAGEYTLALARIQPDFPSYAYQPVHNAFLLFFAEAGVPAAVCLLVVLYTWMQILRANVKRKEGIMIVSLLACLAVLAIFDHYPWSLWSGLSLTALVSGFALRLDRSPQTQ